jgi:uncharacterized protein (DUF2249 family)
MLGAEEERLMAQTVGTLLAQHPELRPVLADLGINHCCGAHLTLEEAAASAGVPLERLLRSIGEHSAPTAPDAATAEASAPRAVLLDVRDDIRRGNEPFARIMKAVKDLAPDEVLVLRAPFEPMPLYAVLGKRGFAHRTDARAADDWWITFYRDAAASPGPDPTRATASVPTTIDVRGLEPPEPMVRVLEALEHATPGRELIVMHDRRPLFLYPQLDDRGFAHETDEPEPGVIRIRIRRGGAAAGSAA